MAQIQICRFVKWKIQKEIIQKRLSIKEFISEFSAKGKFSLNEIFLFYQKQNINVKKNAVQWRTNKLIELGIIQRIGRGIYSFGSNPDFSPPLTFHIKNIYRILMDELSEVKYCIWSTEWIKPYFPEIGDQYFTIVEAERSGWVNSWYKLWKGKTGLTYFSSFFNVFKEYKKKNIIVIRKIKSESPIFESNGIYFPHLEKMIVDLYCDWDKIYPKKKPTFYILFRKLYKNFSVNESRLLRYADRRKKKKIFEKFLMRMKR